IETGAPTGRARFHFLIKPAALRDRKMSAAPLKTLFHPFEAEAVSLPRKGERVLFLGAEPGFRLPEGFDAALHLVQGFRPHFRALQGAGFTVTPGPEGEGFDLALVLVG